MTDVAKIVRMKDGETTIYPITKPEAVRDEDGKNVKQKIDDSEETQRILAGCSPNFVGEDIYGKIHFEVGEIKSRRAQNDAVFRSTCHKVISCTFPTTSAEWAFLFGVQGSGSDQMGAVEEIHPYAFVNTAKMTSLNFAFSNMPNVKDWSFIKHMDTSLITSMSGVFNNSNADEIDISMGDTSSVKTLGGSVYSFWGKTKKIIGLDKGNVSGVTNMSYLFGSYPEFTDVSDIIDGDVSSCENFYYLFSRHTVIETIDLSKWHIKDGSNMGGMFFVCEKLKTLGLPNIPTGASTNFMFSYTSKLTTIFMRDDALIYPSVDFSSLPLSAESVKTILFHLADTPDEGATITFKNGLYSGYSAEDKVEIDTLRNTATTNGGTIVNMG